MQIKLVSEKVPMYFLGDPRNLILSLSCANPGPVELDFYGLTKILQQKVLIALKNGILESDKPFHEIYSDWAKLNPPVEKSETQIVHEENISLEMSQRLQREAKLREKEQKYQERLAYLSTLGFNHLRNSVKNDTELRLFRTLLLMEENGKKRSLNIKYLQHRIQVIEQKLEKEIEKRTAEQLKSFKIHSRKDPLAERFTVIESEKKTIYLSTKELVEIGLSK